MLQQMEANENLLQQEFHTGSPNLGKENLPGQMNDINARFSHKGKTHRLI
jgi:hypothetical protein